MLLADDDPGVQQWLGLLLPSHGYECRHAYDGAHALSILETWRPEVIVTDLQMPVMNGYEFLKVRQGRPDLLSIPVVVATGSASAFPLTDDLKIHAVLTKPYKSETLVTTLAAACSPLATGQALGSGGSPPAGLSPAGPPALEMPRPARTGVKASQRPPVLEHNAPRR